MGSPFLNGIELKKKKDSTVWFHLGRLSGEGGIAILFKNLKNNILTDRWEKNVKTLWILTLLKKAEGAREKWKGEKKLWDCILKET